MHARGARTARSFEEVQRPARYSPSRLLCLGLILLALLGCSGRDRMARQPEAELVYPDSAELAEGGHDRVDDFLGTTRAMWWLLLRTDASIEEVHAFYDAELADRGWETGSRVRSTDEIETYSWTRDGIRFRLGFKELDELDSQSEEGKAFSTVYEISLIETEP